MNIECCQIKLFKAGLMKTVVLCCKSENKYRNFHFLPKNVNLSGYNLSAKIEI